tara:strand:- start:1433 stop:1561 length:129 start_codon:yes stop_codon:yes gene_type:complete
MASKKQQAFLARFKPKDKKEADGKPVGKGFVPFKKGAKKAKK